MAAKKAGKENCRCCDVVRGCESGATVERSETGVANNVCPCGANNRKSGFAKQTGGARCAPPSGTRASGAASSTPRLFPLSPLYGKKFAATGASIAVMIPATAIASPLMAPSTSPICKALLVPMAWAEVPSASPF